MMQEIIEEKGSIGQLKSVVEKYGIAKPFIVCGKSALGFKKFGFDINDFNNAVVFGDYSSNPKYDEIRNGIEIFDANPCDGIVAIGGGSAIDVAKCIKLYSKDAINIPFIAVPTTAGTGSESTCFAVMYKEGIKQSIEDKHILPKCVILDSDLLESLSDFQKKCTVMDALCQAIESYWAVKATKESQVIALEAIGLINGNILPYIYGELSTAEKIMKGANLAGCAINFTRTTAAHAMSYKITSELGLPHGYAVAVCLPEVWSFMNNNIDKCVDNRGIEYLQNVFVKIAAALGFDNVDSAILYLKSLLEKLGLKPFAKDLVISDDIINEFVKSVNIERLMNNPVRLDKGDLESIYKNVFFK